MSAFANFPQHQIVDQQTVETHSIDELMDSEEETIGFLKIDAEDHDFFILKGAESAIGTSVLGVQVECSFASRHSLGPTFVEIFPWMLARGFQLHILARESWLRKNLLWGTNSNPQLVWADAVFFLSSEELFKRLQSMEPGERARTFQRFILMLLVYGAHDYAEELVSQVETLIDDPRLISEMSSTIRQNVESPVGAIFSSSVGALVGLVFGLFGLLTWVARKPAKRFMMRRLSHLAARLSRFTSRGGHLDASFPDWF